jgi:hypothetical protein
MQEYFKLYAEKFHLMDKIQLNTKVIKAEEIQEDNSTVIITKESEKEVRGIAKAETREG